MQGTGLYEPRERHTVDDGTSRSSCRAVWPDRADIDERQLRVTDCAAFVAAPAQPNFRRNSKLSDYIEHILQCKEVSRRRRAAATASRKTSDEILTSPTPSHSIASMSRTEVRKAVIPAAGLGTRFLPATKASPKEMLPLVDKPLIQYAVEEAVASGIEDIIVITGRGKRAIEDHFDRSVELEENLKGSGKGQVLNQMRHISNLANFCYVRQSEALGLGHAVLCAQHLIGDEPFAVILGDEIIERRCPGLAQLIHIYKKRKGAVSGVQEVPQAGSQPIWHRLARRVRNGLHRVEDLVEKPSPDRCPVQSGGHRPLRPAAGNFLHPAKDSARKERRNSVDRCAAATWPKKSPMFAQEIQGQRHDAGDKLGFLIATVEFALEESVPGTGIRRLSAATICNRQPPTRRRRGTGRSGPGSDTCHSANRVVLTEVPVAPDTVPRHDIVTQP